MAKNGVHESLPGIEAAVRYVEWLFPVIDVSVTDAERHAVARALIRLSVTPSESLRDAAGPEL